MLDIIFDFFVFFFFFVKKINRKQKGSLGKESEPHLQRINKANHRPANQTNESN